MTPKEAKKECEKLIADFNNKLLTLNIRSKLYFHGSINMKIVDLKQPNKYHPDAYARVFNILPMVENGEDVKQLLDGIFPESVENDG